MTEPTPMKVLLRPIARAGQASHAAEVQLVAARMRDTLVEVVDEGQGKEMYSMDWLRERSASSGIRF